jgi:hypothetical protein
VLTGLEQLGVRISDGDGRPDRHAAAEPLRRGDDVGGHALADLRILVGEPVAGAADARLDFVEDHEGPELRGEFADGGEVAGRMGAHADLALDGFDEHGRGVLVDGRLERLSVAIGDVDDSGDSGSEGLAVGGLRGQCQRAHGPAVEGPVDGDDERAAPSPGAAGHLERRLVRFGAGVREEHGGSVRQVEDLVQLLGQADLGR